jgi:hypothetical protein
VDQSLQATKLNPLRLFLYLRQLPLKQEFLVQLEQSLDHESGYLPQETLPPATEYEHGE